MNERRREPAPRGPEGQDALRRAAARRPRPAQHQRELVCGAGRRRRGHHRGGDRDRAVTSTGTPTGSSPSCARRSPHTSDRRPASGSRPSRSGPATARTRCCCTWSRRSGEWAAPRSGSRRPTRCTRSSPRTTGTTWVDGLRGTPARRLRPRRRTRGRARSSSTGRTIVFLCSPNNPTGTASSLDVVEAVVDAAPDSLVVVDEAYAEFARPGTPSAMTLLERPAAARRHPDHEQGVRPRRRPRRLPRRRPRPRRRAPAGADALPPVRPHPGRRARRDPARRRACWRRSRPSRRSATGSSTELAGLGYPPVPSDANFVLYGGLADAHATWEALLDRGVLVRDVGIPHHLRVTAGTPDESSAFLQAMADLPDSHRQHARDRRRRGHDGAPARQPEPCHP